MARSVPLKLTKQAAKDTMNSPLNNLSNRMEAIVIPNYTKPDAYGLATVEVPKLTGPSDVLIRVHASSINPVDVQKAAGALKILAKDSYVFFLLFSLFASAV